MLITKQPLNSEHVILGLRGSPAEMTGFFDGLYNRNATDKESASDYGEPNQFRYCYLQTRRLLSALTLKYLFALSDREPSKFRRKKGGAMPEAKRLAQEELDSWTSEIIKLSPDEDELRELSALP